MIFEGEITMLTSQELDMLARIDHTQAKNDLFLEICVAYLNELETLVSAEIINEITSGDKRLEERAFSRFLSSTFIEDTALEEQMHAEYFSPSIKRLDPQEYKSNPYFKNIPIKNEKIGAWTLSYQTYKPYEGFVRDDFTLFDDFREVCNIGFFDEEFSFPTVFENGTEWMAIKPNEIETMRAPIDSAKGNVIAFGLGMGYFAYMASLKDDVSSVTVVEKSKDAISLFKSHILPYFENKEKIKIIEADAFEYVKGEMSSQGYDYAFVDLWHDTSDGTELYIKMKKLEHLCKNTRFEYWIEKSILVTIRKRIFNAIMESIENGKNTLSYNEIIDRLSFKCLRELVKLL